MKYEKLINNSIWKEAEKLEAKNSKKKVTNDKIYDVAIGIGLFVVLIALIVSYFNVPIGSRILTISMGWFIGLGTSCLWDIFRLTKYLKLNNLMLKVLQELQEDEDSSFEFDKLAIYINKKVKNV